jgi:hypothetical protein
MEPSTSPLIPRKTHLLNNITTRLLNDKFSGRKIINHNTLHKIFLGKQPLKNPCGKTIYVMILLNKIRLSCPRDNGPSKEKQMQQDPSFDIAGNYFPCYPLTPFPHPMPIHT